MSTINVTNLSGRGGATPNLPDGANITGVATATSFDGNLKSTGTPTLGLGVTINSSGLAISGVATAGIISATTLYGDGSNYGFLDGVWASWDLKKTTNGALYMNGNTSYYMRLEDTSTSISVAGAIVAQGNVTAYSDRRVKKDITPIANSLDKVQELNGVTFRRTDLADKSKMYAGLIAQDVEAVLPEAVEGNSKKRVDYNAVIGLLVESIKDLKAEVDDLKEQLKNK